MQIFVFFIRIARTSTWTKEPLLWLYIVPFLAKVSTQIIKSTPTRKNSMNHHSINIIITINDVLYKKRYKNKIQSLQENTQLQVPITSWPFGTKILKTDFHTKNHTDSTLSNSWTFHYMFNTIRKLGWLAWTAAYSGFCFILHPVIQTLSST